MQLVYSTFSHGISLRTMYRNMLAFGDTPVLLVVRDDSNKVCWGGEEEKIPHVVYHFSGVYKLHGTGRAEMFFTRHNLLN